MVDDGNDDDCGAGSVRVLRLLFLVCGRRGPPTACTRWQAFGWVAGWVCLGTLCCVGGGGGEDELVSTAKVKFENGDAGGRDAAPQRVCDRATVRAMLCCVWCTWSGGAA